MQQTLAPAASTAQMRESIAERVRRLEPTRTVVITSEYYVRPGDEEALLRLLRDLRSAAADRSGLSHFSYHTPVRAEQTRGVARYDTYEEWGTPDAFLNYWQSSAVREFHSAVERLQVPGHRNSVRPSAGGVGATAPPGAPAAGAVPPLKTGQTDSWDADGNTRPAGAGDDGDWEAGHGVSKATRFRDNNDGTVTDTLTELVWLKNANLFGEVPWPNALVLASQLGAGAAGLTDGSRPGQWRLPNVNEMQSLLDLNKAFGPAIPADSPFTNLDATNYWTSSSVARRPEDPPNPLGWFVALAVGPPVFDLKFNPMRMWPVRERSRYIAKTGQQRCYDIFGNDIPCAALPGQDGDVQAGMPWPAKRFTDNGDDGTVTDNLTGLVWLRNADTFGRLSWQDALDACNTLESGRYDLDDDSKEGDWRLPNINELRSLIDYSQFAPALPRDHPFIGVKSSLYWSSTTVASAPRFARFVFIGIGPSVWDHKSVMMNVWAVRDAR